MKRIVLTALAVFALSGLVFAGAGKEPAGLTISPGVLTVGMEIGYPPMEYLDSDGKTPIGFDVELSKALAAKLGLQAKFIDTAWDGIFAGVTTGKYDVIASAVTVTEERKQAHNFTKPYIGNAQSLVLLKGSSVTARRPEELTGYSVAYQAETASDFYMAKLIDAGLKVTTYEYEKVMNCFDELKLGRVDAIVCDSLVSVDYIALENSPFEMVWQGPAEEVFALCLKKGNNALTAALDKALDELFADGTVLKLSQKIFKMDLVTGIR
ncbi:ABC transporter substrate-binding protein [Breznakiellaceae bacterium SP9]